MYPVGIEPAAVGLGVGLDTDKAELSTNPFALAHLEAAAAIGPFLVVQTIGKTNDGFAAMSHTSFHIRHRQSQVDVLVDAGLVVTLILSSGFERGNELLFLWFAAVGILAGA